MVDIVWSCEVLDWSKCYPLECCSNLTCSNDEQKKIVLNEHGKNCKSFNLNDTNFGPNIYYHYQKYLWGVKYSWKKILGYFKEGFKNIFKKFWRYYLRFIQFFFCFFVTTIRPIQFIIFSLQGFNTCLISKWWKGYFKTFNSYFV